MARRDAQWKQRGTFFAVQDNLKQLRKKYAGRPMPERPSTIDQPSWNIFTECVYQKRPLSVLRKTTRRTPLQIRQILSQIHTQLDPRGTALTAESPIEALDLSVRARNALHRLGCQTIGDVIALDLKQSLRQIGSKGKIEVFAALESGGFRHPAMDSAPSTEVSRLSNSLERLKVRISKTLQAVTREISALQERLARVSD